MNHASRTRAKRAEAPQLGIDECFTGSRVLVVCSNLDNDAENVITLSLVGHSRIVEQRGSTRAKDVDWSGLGRELLGGLCFMRIDTLVFKYF